MAKKEQKDEAQDASQGLAVIQNEQGKEVSVAEIFEQMEKAEVGMELGADYWKIEPGESERVIFVEMTEIQAIGVQGGMTEAVKLVAKDGKFKINADKVIVSTCRSLATKGRKNVPLQITCIGNTKGKGGFSYKEFKINELLM